MFQTLLFAASLAAPSDAPTVTNRIVVVENKVPTQAPPVKALDYRACIAHVAAGGKCVLAVDVPAPPGAYIAKASQIDGECKPGLYECEIYRGVPSMRPLAVPKAMEGPVKRWVKQCVNGVCRLVEVSD